MSKLFYKFVSDDSSDFKVLKSFCAGNIKFSCFPDLNDSSEEFVTTNLDEYNSSLRNVLNKGLSQENMQMLMKHLNLFYKIYPSDGIEGMKELLSQFANCLKGNSLISEFARNTIQIPELMELLTQTLNDVHKEILNKVGIFCVTKRINYYPMWAHYADNAKGFAVEFKNLNKCFNGDNEETEVFHKLKPVEYSDGYRPSVSLEPSDLDEIFFSKLDHWENEREYRVVELLESCNSLNEKIHLFPIDRKYINRIIVGWKCPDDRFEEIKKVCGDISVVRAKLNEFGNIVI